MTEKRAHIVTWWDEAWNDGLWAASWSKAIDGLTSEQAAWAPVGVDGVARSSVWRIVLHMCFWRESWLRRVKTGIKPTDAEKKAGSEPTVTDTSEAAWRAARERFETSQRGMAEALRTTGAEGDTLIYFLPHDQYHMGQIMFLRAMLGLPPIE